MESYQNIQEGKKSDEKNVSKFDTKEAEKKEDEKKEYQEKEEYQEQSEYYKPTAGLRI